MASKKRVSVRLEKLDAFVTGAVAPDVRHQAPGVDAGAITFRRARPKSTIVGSKRRCTVYLSLDTAGRLASHCAAADEDMSSAVEKAVVAYLGK